MSARLCRGRDASYSTAIPLPVSWPLSYSISGFREMESFQAQKPKELQCNKVDDHLHLHMQSQLPLPMLLIAHPR